MRYYRQDVLPPLIKNLMIINALVWLAQISLRNYDVTGHLMLYPVNHDRFAPYQIATYMFAHDPSNAGHLLYNMLSLWLFGRLLEMVWGPKRLLLLYFISGIGAAALHLGIQYWQWVQANRLYDSGQMERALDLVSKIVPMLGASGAIMGVAAAAAYLFPNTVIFNFPFPIKIKWLVIIWVLGDLFGGFGYTKPDNVAHFAHLGGAITGFLLVVIWNRTNRKGFY